MSIISYDQRATKIKEKDSAASLLLIYEWAKTGQITFDVFKSLLEVREQTIADAARYDSFD